MSHVIGRSLGGLIAIGLVGWTPHLASAQSVVYHLHNEASATAGLKQLRSTGPDSAQVVLQTSALAGTATGEKVIAQFDTAAGVPNTAGKIPSGATISAVVWMRKTATVGTLFPRVKVRLNSSTGTALCTATGTTALTTTLAAYTMSCTTTANITLTASSRFYVWAGVNMTAGSTTAFRGELGLEGTLDGAANSRVDIPTALPAPTITTLNPTAGPVGTTVTITGTNFRAQQLSSVVRFFNNRTATATSWSNTSIVVTVPASAATGAVTVTVAGTATAGVTFSVGNVPTVAQLAPSVGLPGTTVVITGTNFGATKGTSTVRLNGVTATTTAWSATSVTATVPASATTGNVVVTVGGIASAGVAFTVPTLNSISVTPTVLTVPEGGEQQYRAWGYYSDNVTRDITGAVTWASSASDVATIAGGGLATITGTTGTATISATLGTTSGATDLTAVPSRFRPVGSMRIGRLNHTATRLQDGRVLITGGQQPSAQITNTAEIYDPATGRFTATGPMSKKRHLHTATLLLNGKVLIVGGLSYFPDEYHHTAELYDPATGTFSHAGYLSTNRSFHTATPLADGRVLIDQGSSLGPFGVPEPLPAEIYDPATALFAVSGTPPETRGSHSTTLLADGTTFNAGGYQTPSSERFDPTSGTYATGPTLSTYHSEASRLPDGRVLLTGGGVACPEACAGALYLPASNTVTPTYPMSVGRNSHTSTLLEDGTVLVVGGQSNGVDTATAEIYDPATNTFTAAGSMAASRWGQTATRLEDGTVLIVGGSGPLARRGAELYVPAPIVALSLAVTPATATLSVGASRSFNAVDHLGHPRTDAVWSSTNPSVLTVDPVTGEVTAIAAGSATVMAALGTVSGLSQVTVVAGAVPTGTPLWTVGAPPGTTSQQLLSVGRGLMAVSTTSTGTELQGLTPDGLQQWRIGLQGAARQVVPNASGGVLVTLSNGCNGASPLTILSIDGPTGMWAWAAEASAVCNYDLPQIAVRHDGAVAVSTPGNVAGFPNLMMLNGDTGAPLSVPAIPQSTFTSFSGQQTLGYSRVGPTMIDAEGTTHLLYEKRFLAYPPQVVNTGIWLMSVRADQTFTTSQLSTTTANVNLFPGRIIPDGQGGLLTSWIESPIVPAGQPPAQSTFRAYRTLAGGGGIPFDLPITPPLDLLHPVDSPLPTNPELLLGEGGRAFASYGNSVSGFFVNDGTGGWSYTAASDITMVATAVRATAVDPSLVATTRATDGTDTILRFQDGGGLSTSTFGVANISHVVKDMWVTSSPAGATGALLGENIDWAETGWSIREQGGTNAAKGHYALVGASRADPEQSVIRATFQQAKFKLEQEALLPPPDRSCSDWFNYGPGVSAAQYILDGGFLDNNFSHADFTKGGSLNGGDSTSAFAGVVNDPGPPPVLVDGVLPNSAVAFNRRGSFFVRGNFFTKWGKKVGPFDGATPEARLTIVLHELAHLLQDPRPVMTSVQKVPGFNRDGQDKEGTPEGTLSAANTKLILSKCEVMIRRP